jgi:FtsP/CotA-like multicopper oxidase with cupredoxin domain
MKRALVSALLACLFSSIPAHAAFKDLPASKDNTLFQSATGDLSNGAGEWIFAGKNDKGLIRRIVMQFAVSESLPPGATIDSVSLNLFLSRSKLNTSKTTTVFRLLASWGEGRSNAAQNEGGGAPADTGDATWIHRSRYPDILWGAAGGDFDPTPHASTLVASNNFYRWSSVSMKTDVQSWLDNPAFNFGWIVIGDESASTTATRFNSRQNTDTTRRPYLRVYYTASGGDPTGACCLPGDLCSITTQLSCIAQGGTYHGDNVPCAPNPCLAPPTTVTVAPSKDNTLYEDATGSLSNGGGTKLLTSKSSVGTIRRGTLAFDLLEIPTGATVTGAALTLYNAEAGTNSATVNLHKATADWGEGTSTATGTEDAGAPSTTGDATWVHRFYPGTIWTTAGGDFVSTASASASVLAAGTYTWTSAALIADVQGWIDVPTSNFGWFIRGKETGPGNALKRFESRQSSDTAHRPQLTITFQAPPGPPTGACCLPTGLCDTLNATDCAAAGGTYQGDNTSCTPAQCPVVLQPFVDPLPLPAVATPTSGTIGGAASYQIAVTEFKQRLHRDLPLTTVWGYGGSYPGPTILASVGNQVNVTWVNDLRDSTGAPRTTHYLPVDLCVHGADMYGDAARIVTHLHGGHVGPESDGYPTQTSLPGQRQTFHYPNINQLPGTLWYHDHALGITRLNVIMGLAGFYLLTDAYETALGLPSGEYEVGLAIQDRTFHPDGSLEYPAVWQDHWFGDKALVNGKVWPYFNVNRGKYRFRMLNGSTSRVYTLKLSNGAPFTQLGTEGGLLGAPVTRDSITITPGERADVVIDFAPFTAGTEIILENTAPAPFPIGDPMEPALPQIMKFVVQSATGFTAPIPGTLRPVTPLVETDTLVHRDFVLAKTPGPAPCGGSIWTINGRGFDDVTEFPILGSTEVWRFINRSGSVHPMHMHLTMFQILDRQSFIVQADTIVLTGAPIPPGPEEAGWKDTAPVYPNQVMRVITRFEDYAGRYVYHCHILEHEENDMMRQFQVVHGPITAVDEAAVRRRFVLNPATPNPLNPWTRIAYELPAATHARIDIFDIAGRHVATVLDSKRPAGPGSVVWAGADGRGARVATGVYVYRLTAQGAGTKSRKMVVLK